MQLDTNNHSVFLLYYHLVLVTKYRRKVINDNISRSFCLLTTGGAPIEIIKKYIESQGKKA